MRFAEIAGRIGFGLGTGGVNHSFFGSFRRWLQFLTGHIGFFTGRAGGTRSATATATAATAAGGPSGRTA